MMGESYATRYRYGAAGVCLSYVIQTNLSFLLLADAELCCDL